MKNSNVLLRPNNFPPPNRECVCSESAREEVQKRAIQREGERERECELQLEYVAGAKNP